MARGVWGTHFLVGRRFAGDKCVCWWEVILLVKHCSAGETRFAGETLTRFAGQTCFSGPNAFFRAKRELPAERALPGRTHIALPERKLPAGREFLPERNLLARTQFAGIKTK